MQTESVIIDLIWEAEQDEPPSLNLQGYLSALLPMLELESAELSVLVTDDANMQKLNKQYRGKDQSTDVLSFVNSGPTPPGEVKHLGDIVISHDQASRQAQSIGHDLVFELRFLTLHGVLHLVGYDHETDDGKMMALQSRLKQELGSFFQKEEPFLG